MTRIAPSTAGALPGATPADIMKPKRLAAMPQGEMTPGEANSKPKRAADPDRVKWFNTPFARRLDILLHGKAPDWITNKEDRIAWLKHQISGAKNAHEVTPADAPGPSKPEGPGAMGLAARGGATADLVHEALSEGIHGQALAARLRARLDVLPPLIDDEGGEASA